jgi:AAA+ ATPase superfamily predicted ATPase
VPVEPYSRPLVESFLNRTQELDRLETWWNDDVALPLALIGRRRVGKSWLFRRFGHEKPCVIFVAEQ